MTDETPSLVKDLIAAQQTLDNPTRSKLGNPKFKNHYAPLEDILPPVREALNQHNIYLSQRFVNGNLRTELLHISGEVLSSEMPLPAIDDAQRLVGWTTYMRRVQLTSILGLRDEDDDDGQVANGARRKREPVMDSPADTKMPDNLNLEQPLSLAAKMKRDLAARGWTADEGTIDHACDLAQRLMDNGKVTGKMLRGACDKLEQDALEPGERWAALVQSLEFMEVS